jgi:hypothetical protein
MILKIGYDFENLVFNDKNLKRVGGGEGGEVGEEGEGDL